MKKKKIDQISCQYQWSGRRRGGQKHGCVWGSNSAFAAEIFQIKPSTDLEREGANNCPQKLNGAGESTSIFFLQPKRRFFSFSSNYEPMKKKSTGKRRAIKNTPPPSKHRGTKLNTMTIFWRKKEANSNYVISW